MPEAYRDQVLKYYQLKRSRGDLSPNLLEPTPASIRDECILTFTKNRSKKDQNIIRLFVEDRETLEDYERALRNVEVTKFRPLQSFLLDPTINTSNRNIELLAWLIGYRQGFESLEDSDWESKKNDSENNTAEGRLKRLTSKESSEIAGGSTQHSKPLQPALTKKRNVIILLIGITAISVFLLGQRAPKNLGLAFLTPDPSCMYWNGHNYVGSNDCTVIGKYDVFNKSIMDNQKWISCADTITEKHINKIWYIRNNNLVELFTMPGQYPADRNRRLNRLSQHIYNKYVLTKRVKVDCDSKK